MGVSNNLASGYALGFYAWVIKYCIIDLLARASKLCPEILTEDFDEYPEIDLKL